MLRFAVLALAVFFVSGADLTTQRTCPPTRTPEVIAAAKPRPNIMLLLADDLDSMLGSFDAGALKKTSALLGDGGARAENWFAHTPICCPSRAELLTGRYFHGIKTTSGLGKGCMHVAVNVTDPDDKFYNEWYALPHFKALSYNTAYFGKHLNNNNPACPPPGVDHWFGNNGGNYLNPTFAVGSAGGRAGSVTFDNATAPGGAYSTSVIGNATVDWLSSLGASRAAGGERHPFMAVVAVKAPHIQDGPGWPITIPAPWHSQAFLGAMAPRVPAYNLSCPTHHWLVRQQPPLTTEQGVRVDALYAARMASLLAVDDTISEIIAAVGSSLGADEAANTYFVFTSDHGYRLGQMRMAQGKWHGYDLDHRVPFLIRGPGVQPGSIFPQLASHVDLMPTLLGLAGVRETPVTMDGRSLASHLVTGSTSQWRTELLLEYWSGGPVIRYEHLEDTHNNTFRAIRVMDPSADEGLRNLKLIEFTSWSNWNWTEPADESELFDLDADPWEISNLYATASAGLKERLHKRLVELSACRGTKNCG